MENRLVIKKIHFTKIHGKFKQDVKIKLSHNNINLLSDIFWEYNNNELINWKFIFDYDNKNSIDFIIIDDELFNEDNILGYCSLKKQQLNINSSEIYEFPDRIYNELNIMKDDENIGTLYIEEYIIPKDFSKLFKCGDGWDLPDSYPKLKSFPLKKHNEIYQHIKIIDDKFGIEEKTAFDLYSEAFSRIIDEPENKPPLTFGIIGPNNYGKTNFLHNLKKKILDKENTKYKNAFNPKKVIIDFNAWSFEAADTIWANILIYIHNSLEEKLGKKYLKWLRIKKALFPTYTSVFLFILKLLIPIILLIIVIIYNEEISNLSTILISIFTAFASLFLVKDIFEFIKNMLFSIGDNITNSIKKPDWNKQLGFMNEIKTEFFDFINPVIKENNLRLILLIDDLDRCSVEKIYIVIKALSLLKNSDCPIYIFLTYNSVAINDAIKTYYKTTYNLITYESTHLLEKLINIPFCLPEKNIIENLSLIENYFGEEYFLNLRNDIIKKIPDEFKIFKGTIVDMDKTFENYYTKKFPNRELPNKKTILNQLVDTTEANSSNIIINTKSNDSEDKLLQIEQNLMRDTVSLNQLENYYRYLIKIEKDYGNKSRLNEIKNMIYIKFIYIKKDYTNNYYVGLDKEEIKTFQSIIQETKHSGNPINNNQIKKIINIYSIARFILPSFLQNKKNILFHLIVVTEKWQKIIIQLYTQINKIKYNLTLEEVKECFKENELLFFYLNNDKVDKNDELIIYLTKYDIKIIDFIELNQYIYNLDRCNIQ